MARRVSSKRSKPPAKWVRIFATFPGYDPITSAGAGEYFDARAADTVVAFFHECLQHIEGELAGSPFILEMWEQAIVGAIFGWKRADGSRRYREVFVFIPRKNGKTPLAAGLANYVLFCDSEAGQQNVCAAAEREQASLLYRHARGMVEREPELLSRAHIYAGFGQRAIVLKGANSGLRVISADAKTKHGGNLHLAIIDELHAQPNRELVDVIQTSMASSNRRQPILFYITTSDFEREGSICNEKHDYACRVRDGVIVDPAFLPVIFEADKDDDWTSERTWEKANPNLDVSVSRDYLRRECKRAQETPTYENTFKRLHLNIRTEQAVRWLPLDKWDACAGMVDSDALAGRECYAGLDMSTTTDLTALVLVFPDDNDHNYDILVFPFVPDEGARIRARRDRAPYLEWIRYGLIAATPGNVVDYDFVRKQINELGEVYEIKEIAIDRWNSSQLQTQLQGDGFTIAQFGQGFRSMSAPTKKVEELVLGCHLRHGGHPVLRWCVSNVSIEMDPAGNIKPSKKKSSERIDCVVALVMAVGRAMLRQSPVETYLTVL